MDGLPGHEPYDRIGLARADPKVAEHCRIWLEAVRVEVGKLVITGILRVAAWDLALVGVRRAYAVRERIHDPVGLYGELGVVEHHGRNSPNGACQGDRRSHDPRRDVWPERPHDLHQAR